MPDLSLSYYAGRWVALTEERRIVSVGTSENEARTLAHRAQPKTYWSIAHISPNPPYVAVPAWPIARICEALNLRDDSDLIWLAGGPVRDLLTARAPHDWDFVVPEGGLRTARTLADALEGTYYCLDKERGTGRAIVPLPKAISPADMVTASKYQVSAKITLDVAELRGPDLKSDLQVRDFTINAMAMRLDGTLIDPLGGYEDLTAQRLRLTHPEAFEADPARLLRVVRQAIQFGFEITPPTRQQAQAAAGALTRVAAERVRDELVKILAQPAAAQAITELSTLNLLPQMLPEAARLARAADRSAWRATLMVLTTLSELQRAFSGDSPTTQPRWMWRDVTRALSDIQRPLLSYLTVEPESEITRETLVRWAGLYHRIPHAAAKAESRLATLRFSRNAIAFVTRLLRGQERVPELPPTPTRRQIYRYYQTTGDTGPGNVLLSLARVMASYRLGAPLSREDWHDHLTQTHSLWFHYFHHPEVVDPEPLLTGRDVMALGVAPGPAMGCVLETLREAQAAGDVQTIEGARDYVRRWIDTL